MKVNEIYSSGNWLKAEDLPEEGATVTIHSYEVIEQEKESDYNPGQTYIAKQIVLHFEGSDKKLGLNKTNANHLAELLGE